MPLPDHPAYAEAARALVCAICRNTGEVFESVDIVTFEEHFLNHAPGPELAKEFLSPRTYASLARARGWSRNLRKVIDQIRKLHRLSQSPNNHEAALAAARAAELMLRYQVDTAMLDADLEAPEDVVGEHTVERLTKVIYWRASILGALAKTMGCEMLLQTRRARERFSGKIVERRMEYRIIGSAQNAEAIRYMYAYFCKEIAVLADRAFDARIEARAKIKSVRSYKNAHRSAAAGVVANRLLEARERHLAELARAIAGNASLERALVRMSAEQEAVKRYVEKLRVDDGVTTTSGKPELSNVMGALDGMNDGKKVDLGANKPGLTAGAPRLRGRSGT